MKMSLAYQLKFVLSVKEINFYNFNLLHITSSGYKIIGKYLHALATFTDFLLTKIRIISTDILITKTTDRMMKTLAHKLNILQMMNWLGDILSPVRFHILY